LALYEEDSENLDGQGRTNLRAATFADFACVGEGEETFVQLVLALGDAMHADLNAINGLVWRTKSGFEYEASLMEFQNIASQRFYTDNIGKSVWCDK